MLALLVTLVIVLVLLGVVGMFLRWVMPQLGLPDVIQKIVWVLFGLLCFLIVLGVFGHGPMAGAW